MLADVEYGSEENYDYLESKGIETYVKYNTLHKELTSKKHQTNPFLSNNLYYNEETDSYYCPMGQEMRNIGSHKQKTKIGYSQEIKQYQAQNCVGCSKRGACHKSKNNRIIQRNENLYRHRKRVKKPLTSEEGIEKIKAKMGARSGIRKHQTQQRIQKIYAERTGKSNY